MLKVSVYYFILSTSMFNIRSITAAGKASKLQLLLHFFYNEIYFVFQKSKFVVQMDSVNCTIFNRRTMRTFECNIIDKLKINFNMSTNIDLVKDYTFNYQLNGFRNGVAYQFLKFQDINACNIFTQTYGNTFFDHMMQEIQKSSNLPLGCPIRKVCFFVIHI